MFPLLMVILERVLEETGMSFQKRSGYGLIWALNMDLFSVVLCRQTGGRLYKWPCKEPEHNCPCKVQTVGGSYWGYQVLAASNGF